MGRVAGRVLRRADPKDCFHTVKKRIRKTSPRLPRNPFPLPPNLPAPVDDGAANHLVGTNLPDLLLPGTSDRPVNLYGLPAYSVLYVYPMTGRPGVPLPEGWDDIPGARGCTPQSCGFRDQHARLMELCDRVYGLSTQTTEYQREARERLQLPFDLLSDAELRLKKLLRLPTFKAGGMELYKRLTLILHEGQIEKVFYPVFPPDKNAGEVMEWLRKRCG